MSFKNRTIAVSAAALLLAGGGIYAFMHNDSSSISDGPKIASSIQTDPKPEVTAPQQAPSEQNVEKSDIQDINTTAANQPATPGLPAAQAPKKLTRQQLLPPSATEEEKLQKAAEQESNF